VQTKDGGVERFVVNHLSEVVDHLQPAAEVDGGEVARLNEPRSRAAGPWIRTGLLLISVIVLILLTIFVF
jgi:hypothetical protein